MACSARLAPASMLLAVILAIVPLLLPLSSAGGLPHRVVSTAAVAVAIRPETSGFLHLRRVDLSLPVRPAPAAGPASPATHTVAPGDTLWRISQTAGVSVAALAAANHISEDATLHLGQVLTVPAPGTPDTKASVSSQTHTVAPGDTLWQISQTAGVSVAVLAAANHISEDAILHLGQVLSVPPPGPAPLASAPRRTASQAGSPLRAARARTPIQALPTALAGAVGSRLQMLWPSYGTVTSRFGWRTHPIFGTREFHTGMDIATRWGSPVLAAYKGIVRFVGWKAGYGRLVIVDHGAGLETAYSHLSAAMVQPGTHVVQGQEIGHVGNTGWSTGPHLLFEVFQNGVPRDPARFLN